MTTRLVAQVSVNSLLVTAERRGHAWWKSEVGFEGLPALSDCLAGLAEHVVPHRLPRRILVRLEPPLVQCRSLTDLPPVREPALRQLVARGTGRFFRQNGHALISSAVWTGEGAGQRANAAAVEIELAEAILAGSVRAGLRVEDIVPAGASPRLSLLPPAERALRERMRWRDILRLAVAVALLWLVVGAIGVLRLTAETRRVESELARLEGPRVALMAARAAMDSARSMLAALDEARALRGQVADRIAAITRLLPDSAFLTGLTLEGRKSGLITGRARRVPDVTTALKTGKVLGRVEFDGTPIRDTLDGLEWERFSVRLEELRNP